MKSRKSKYILFGILILMAFCSYKSQSVSAEEMVSGETLTQEETTEQETTSNNEPEDTTLLPQEPTNNEPGEDITREAGVTKPHKPADHNTSVSDKSTAVAKYNVVNFTKQKKRRAKIYVFSQGKTKTKKTKIIVTVQKNKGGKWVKVKKIQKAKNSFFCTLSEIIKMKKSGNYRAVVKVIYYSKKKKKLGTYKKTSKTIYV
jgi:hypothetical protein